MKKTISLILFQLLIICNLSYSGWILQNSGTVQNLNSIIFSHGDENTAWACGDNGIILHTTNGGINWVVQNSGTTYNLYAIVFMEVSGGPVFAVGESGTILRTTNDGANWNTIPSPVSTTLRDISDFNFIIVGDSGTILKSTNTGVNWSVVPSPVNKRFNAISATFTYYIVGDSGTILRGFNLGLTWNILNSSSVQNLYGVPLFGSADITVGDNGLVLRSTNIGANWFTPVTGTGSRLKSVEYSTNNTSRIYACGYNGTILKSTNNGFNWGFQSSPVTHNLNSLFFYLNDNTGYACGNSGTILKTTDGGGAIFTDINKNTGAVPSGYKLYQNYPNPFNPVTKIKFELPKSSYTSLKVFDMLGREVSSLINEQLTAGTYEISFSGSASGVYFYKLETPYFTEVKKMILSK